ncbi:hypothetical protein CSIM01_06666 [Colletotrichum simmondsii]|uniref:Uncharacterized protein n=1 Tax=Colletotrichum simmondsii TaxID=703756 RepID=A0A135SUT7_9PEZI|nr:hypothetical protein CSIM01_06666 [Colletotrichum simmondsii]
MPSITLLTTPGARSLNHEVLAKMPGLLFADRAKFFLGDDLSCAMLLGQSMTQNLTLPKHPNAVKFYIYKMSKRLHGLIIEAHDHLTELKNGTKSLRRIMNEHRQHEFWTLVFGRLRTNRKWEVFTPHGPQIASKAELVGLFYEIPDDCDLLFAPSPPGRAASPVDDAVAVAAAATVAADESSDNTTEEQEDQEDDSTAANNSLVALKLWAIVRPLVNREQERLGLRTYRRNDLAKYLRNNTQ